MSDAEIVRDAMAWVGTEDIGSQGPNDEIRLPALAALERLESQNQALQGRNAELERRAAVRVEHMLDDDHAALSNQVVALQERAEIAELAWTAANDRLAALTRVDHLDPSNNGTIPVLREALQRIASMSPSTDNAGWLAAVTIARSALSPTQETDLPPEKNYGPLRIPHPGD